METIESLTKSDLYETFLQAYSPVQFRIMAYIRTLIHDRTGADDVFQETSLVLWRRFPEFRQDGDFLQWALGISRRQVLKYWRKTRRDQQFFSEAFLERLSIEAFDVTRDMDVRQDALETCIHGLTDRQRELIRKFYGEGMPAEVIAVLWNRSVHSVYKCLRILRRTLFHCVEQRLVGGL